MLKGNLIVGKNQSVVVHAESLHDLIKLAESKSRCADQCGSLSLRVNLAKGDILAENLFSSARNLPGITRSQNPEYKP